MFQFELIAISDDEMQESLNDPTLIFLLKKGSTTFMVREVSNAKISHVEVSIA